MSKRNLNSYFTFDEPEDEIAKKIKIAFSGGRGSKKEQQELGGEPQKCMIYKILMYHFEENDKKLEEDFKRCVCGELLCGEHKKECVEKVLKFVREHRKKKEKLLDKARTILSVK